MKKIYLVLAALATMAAASCVKEKREVLYTNQENKIDQYISSKMYTMVPTLYTKIMLQTCISSQ